VDCTLDFSLHAPEAVFSKWLVVCELWSPVQIHIIITCICWGTECEQYTFFAGSERWWVRKKIADLLRQGAFGVV
jgi:hypothetical protein